MSSALAALCSRAARKISTCDHLLVCTGAGMGVDSGLATYRGRNAGVWPPLAKLGLDLSEMSNPQWFDRDPQLAWAFWHFRMKTYFHDSEPHAGYHVIGKWGEKMLARGSVRPLFVFTSNVDGHWDRVGYFRRVSGATKFNQSIVECHGAVTRLQCTSSCSRQVWATPGVPTATVARAEGTGDEETVPGGAAGRKSMAQRLNLTFEDENTQERVSAKSGLPTCPKCKCALLRPNVLMFGDWDYREPRPEVLDQAGNYARWRKQVVSAAAERKRKGRVVVLEIGAGHAIPTVRMEAEERTAEFFAQSSGIEDVTFIRVNFDDPEIDTPGAGAGAGGFFGSRSALPPDFPFEENAISIGGHSAKEVLERIDREVEL